MTLPFDVARVKGNIRKMLDQNAPEADVDAYVASEGTTADELRAHAPPPAPMPGTPGTPDMGAPAGGPDVMSTAMTQMPPPAAIPEPPPEPPQPEPPGRSWPMMMGQAVGRGISDMSFPLDIAGMGANVNLSAADWLREKAGLDPIGFRVGSASHNIADAAAKGGTAAGLPVVNTDKNAMPWSDTAQYETAKGGTMGLLTDLALRGISKGRAPITPGGQGRFFDNLFRMYDKAPPAATAALGTAAGAGGGLALSGSQQIPDEIRNMRPAYIPGTEGGTGMIADMVAMGVGGVSGGTLGNMLLRGPGALQKTFTRHMPSDIPLDAEGKTVSNKVADDTKRWLQGVDPNTEQSAANIDRNRAWVASNIPAGPDGKTPMPSAFLMSESPELFGVDKFLRMQTPGPYIRSDEAVRAGATSKVGEIRTPGVNQPGGVQTSEFPDTAANIVQGRQATADQRVASAQDRVTTEDFQRRREGTDLQTQYGGEPQRQAALRADAEYTESPTGYFPTRTEKNTRFDTAPGREDIADVQPILDGVRDIRDRLNTLVETRKQMPEEFMQRLRKLAPDVQETTLPDGTINIQNMGGDNTARVGDLADLRIFLNKAGSVAEARGEFKLAKALGDLKININQFIEQHPGYTEANQYYREFADKYRPGRGDAAAKFTRDLDRDPTRSTTPPSETVPRFMTGNAEDADAFRRGMPPGGGVDATVDWMMGNLAEKGALVGEKLDANRLQTWRRTNSAFFNSFPEMGPRVDDLINRARVGEMSEREARAVLQETQAGRRNVERDTAQGPLGVVTSGGKNADNAVDAVFNSGHPPRNMTRLRDEMQRHDERGARQALQDAQTDLTAQQRHLTDVQAQRRTGQATAEDLTAANEHVSAARATLRDAQAAHAAIDGGEAGSAVRAHEAAVSEWLYKKLTNANPQEEAQIGAINRIMKENESTIAAAFGPNSGPKMNALREGQRFLEFLTNRAKQATTGSPTAEYQQLTDRMIEVAFKVRYGQLRGGGYNRNFQLMAKTLAKPGESASEQMVELAHRMASDPTVAMAVLRRDVSRPPPAWNSRGTRIIRRERATSDAYYGKDAAPPEEE